MPIMASIKNKYYTENSSPNVLESIGIVLEDTICATAQKIKEIVTSPLQLIFGFGLGLGLHKIYAPLTNKIIKALRISIPLADPFSTLDLSSKIFLTPIVCILVPLLEEYMFRGTLQETLKDVFESFYINLGFSLTAAETAARVTSLFFSSVIFGLAHFTNALIFWCNPIIFLPQVVATTIMGLLFGLAKEFSGDLSLPSGMHIGNNTLAWIQMMKV
jgi:membrane protease YdiL (CAAX protease family)